MKNLKPNGISNLDQQILSFILACLAGIICARLSSYLLGNNEITFWLLCIPFVSYFLIAGAYWNGELEHSVQGILGSTSPIVLVTGLSWGIPRPVGSSILKRSIAPRTTNMTGDAAIAEVNARDGAQVSVSVVLQWRIKNVRIAGQFSPEELERRVKDIEDRGVRWFALYRDSDGAGPNSLSKSKADFSRYLVGDPGLKAIDIYDESGTKSGTEEIDHDDPNSMQNKFDLIGVEAITAEVKDVNPPQDVIESRNAEAAELSQASREKKDMESLRLRILELMWGTSDEDEIKTKKEAGETPLMSESAARVAARTARKDVTETIVSGDGGDFTKGAALSGRKE